MLETWKNAILSRGGLIAAAIGVAALGTFVVIRKRRHAEPEVRNPAGGARTKKQRRKARLHHATA
jgi:hypothetical protein